MDRLEHRKGKAVLHFQDREGKPLVGKAVEVRQKKQEFLFGCNAFDTLELCRENLDGQRREILQERMELWLDLFNFATLPFYWGQYEPEEGKTNQQNLMAAAQFLKKKGITIKGHPLCWHTQTASWLLNLSNEEILERQLMRIRRNVGAFKGTIDAWDVINEVVIMPVFDKYDNGITRICKDMGRIKLVKRVFEEARKSNPGAMLVINDFNTSQAYEILIEGCLEAGVPISTIGIQSHQHQGYWGIEKIQEVLERFSHFGLPLHFTENTLISGHLMPSEIEDLNDYQIPYWPTTPEGEERQAREVVEMYTVLFESPYVQAITTWDFDDDNKWLGAPCGLIRKDNSQKPAYVELKKKIKEEWMTSLSLVTDPRGNLEFTGFAGEYEISCLGETKEISLKRTPKENYQEMVMG